MMITKTPFEAYEWATKGAIAEFMNNEGANSTDRERLLGYLRGVATCAFALTTKGEEVNKIESLLLAQEKFVTACVPSNHG